MFLQERKCSYESLLRMGHKIWKGNKVMVIDVEGMDGGSGDSMEPMVDRTLRVAS